VRKLLSESVAYSDAAVAAIRDLLALETGAPIPGGAIGAVKMGTTVATNIAVQMNGSSVGLLTTAGFRDTIHIMQGHGYTAGIPDEMVTDVQRIQKPPPLVPKSMIREVFERIDSKGDVVVALNEDQARNAAEELVEAGAESIAICFLWSFLNEGHEKRMREIVAEIAPDLFVTTSTEIAPKSGEYARTVATTLNAFTFHMTSLQSLLLKNALSIGDSVRWICRECLPQSLF